MPEHIIATIVCTVGEVMRVRIAVIVREDVMVELVNTETSANVYDDVPSSCLTTPKCVLSLVIPASPQKVEEAEEESHVNYLCVAGTIELQVLWRDGLV